MPAAKKWARRHPIFELHEYYEGKIREEMENKIEIMMKAAIDEFEQFVAYMEKTAKTFPPVLISQVKQ